MRPSKVLPLIWSTLFWRIEVLNLQRLNSRHRVKCLDLYTGKDLHWGGVHHYYLRSYTQQENMGGFMRKEQNTSLEERRGVRDKESRRQTREARRRGLVNWLAETGRFWPDLIERLRRFIKSMQDRAMITRHDLSINIHPMYIHKSATAFFVFLESALVFFWMHKTNLITG